MITASALIKKFNLQPHPEGGYYAETYRSAEAIPANGLPERFGGNRAFSTAIYFLLEQGNFSAFHKIKSDECWHFYAGQTLLIYVIDKDGKLITTKLGNDLNKVEVFQYTVPAGSWFASEPDTNTAFSFVGCTVAPGFSFEDFELADAKELVEWYPQHKDLISRLCLSS
ncbi:MAG: cupin domain-containing protein [Agriterribacter sp.]